VAGDEVYGADPKLRKNLAARGTGFVLAVPKSHRITTGIGARRAIDLAVRLRPRAWQRLSAGVGAKGPRLYDWVWVEATDPAVTSGNVKDWLLSAAASATGSTPSIVRTRHTRCR
jgi:hypothetical protein